MYTLKLDWIYVNDLNQLFAILFIERQFIENENVMQNCIKYIIMATVPIITYKYKIDEK